MLEIKYIRENVDIVKHNMQRKNRTDLHCVDELLSLDAEYRKNLTLVQQLRAKRNTLSEQVNKAKKEGKDVQAILAQVRDIPIQIQELETENEKLLAKIKVGQKAIPNIMSEIVPAGKNDADNKEIRTVGKIPSFDFEVKGHQQIATDLGMADFDSAATVSGNGFYYLQGDLALLNQALIRFALEHMVREGFTYVETPLLLRDKVISNVVDLNDRQNQIYKIEQDDLFLIGTSEHSLIGRFIDAVIPENKLPVLQTSYSMCFRKEKGAHGIDERGLFRTHQFNKVEMVVLCKPEESVAFYERLQNITVSIFQALDIPIRVLQICTGDLGNLKHNQVDIEAWSPRKNGYIEVGSCSNLTASQATMLNIRYNDKHNEKHFVHTLNNTAIATSRAMVAILENNQQSDGSVRIPQALQPLMFGKKILTKQ